MILFSLLLCACGGNKITPDVPDSSKEAEQTADKTSHPWDVNRGKEVHPSAGNGWTVTVIDEGITYYAFDGKESVTGTNQRIFVTDIDLNNPAYAVKLAYYSGRSTASKVFSSTGAIACINGGYEMTSIYVNINGSTRGSIANDYITSGDYRIPQWKSEAAVYLDNDRDVRIRFTGKGKNLAEWRAVYSQEAKTEKNFLTSTPMLIDDFEPVGESFCTLHPVQYPSCSEDPNVHQGSNTNPRTALATTESGHVLFIVVDGRREGISRGISAAHLTRFLVKNFNPQYAINLDGGGSSTMCVRGQGDPFSHVVNYPCDNRSKDANGSPKENGGPDHAGERSVPTFFYVVKK